MHPLPSPKSTVIEIDSETDLFEQVVELHKTHKKWLGPFPLGAFHECSAKKGLFGIVGSNNQLLAYISLRYARDWTHVVHLCVDPKSTKKGLGKTLLKMAFLKSNERGLAGVRLSCRRDFSANNFWPKMGMVAAHEKLGRGKIPSELNIWIRRNKRPDLFTDTTNDTELPLAVLDANVFYDLNPSGHEQRNQESLCLLADWLNEALTFCLVDEIYNDIERNSTTAERDIQRNRVQSYLLLPPDPEKSDSLCPALFDLLNWNNPTPSQRSDVAHIAKSIVNNASYFLTRDEELLAISDEILERFELRIVRPIDLASSFDFENRKELYEPARFCGTNLNKDLLTERDTDKITETFQASTQGESQSQFKAKFRSLVALSLKNRNQGVWQIAGATPHAVYSAQISRDELDSEMIVELLRVAHSPACATLAQHTILGIIQEAYEQRVNKIIICERLLSSEIVQALRTLHFSQSSGKWTRSLLRERITIEEASERFQPKAQEIQIPMQLMTTTLEASHWPLKITGGNVITYTVPIRPEWARQLFDKNLSEQELFGSSSDLALNRENVYYRSSKSPGPVCPARILWYVTKTPNMPGTGAIRACSRLISVKTGPAKRLFSEFKRIGVYQWREIQTLTEGNPYDPIMALHFADTELFSTPVSLDFLKGIGTGKMLQSPCKIDEEQFIQIYEQGTST